MRAIATPAKRHCKRLGIQPACCAVITRCDCTVQRAATADPQCHSMCVHQVCAEYRKANALIRPGGASGTTRVWARLHAEIEQVRDTGVRCRACKSQIVGSALERVRPGCCCSVPRSCFDIAHHAAPCSRARPPAAPPRSWATCGRSWRPRWRHPRCQPATRRSCCCTCLRCRQRTCPRQRCAKWAAWTEGRADDRMCRSSVWRIHSSACGRLASRLRQHTPTLWLLHRAKTLSPCCKVRWSSASAQQWKQRARFMGAAWRACASAGPQRTATPARCAWGVGARV